VVDYPGCFVWYELITTDVAAAKVFYADVVGWGTQDAPTPDFSYALLTAGTTPVGGVTELPEVARQRGATPRWAGYVGVKDIDVAADRIKRLGGAVYVPPTDSNIGRIAIVSDPQTANFALVKGLKPAQMKPGTNCTPPIGRRRWLFTPSFLAGRKRISKSASRTPISRLPSTGRRSAACSPNP
jgi:predicted enzyme related to lactoylglutathione lyase